MALEKEMVRQQYMTGGPSLKKNMSMQSGLNLETSGFGDSDDGGEYEENEREEETLEDVRMSNSAFTQIKIGESISVIFSILGILTGICSSETGYYNVSDSLRGDITTLNYINVFATICLTCSIWMNYQLTIRWKRSRKILT